MAVPTPYVRGYSFSAFQANAPQTPLPGQKVDTELDNVQRAMNETQSGLADIRRADGRLKNGIVTIESLASELLTGVGAAVEWTALTAYKTNATVFWDAAFYRALVEHTSSLDFAADLAAGKWLLFADLAPYLDSSLASMGAVLDTRTISTTAPLAGGGDLSANRTLSISANGITNGLLAQVPTATFKGRTAGGTGDVQDLTATQATALLNAVVGDSGSGGTKGLVPAPAAGDGAASKYLRADGTWSAPAAVGSGVAVGSAVIHFGNTAPPGTLKANGAAVSTTTYAALDAAIYCGNADNATAPWGYRCTNPASPSSTRSTSGGYIVLPDARGEFLRGWDDGRGVDSGRSFWAAQLDAYQAHEHTQNKPSLYDELGGAGPGSSIARISASAATTGNVASTGGTPRTASETRPRNLSPLICIRY